MKKGDIEISYGDKNISENLVNYTVIIYNLGAFEHQYGMGSFRRQVLISISPEALRREKEIYQALEKGRLVCFIGAHGDARALKNFKYL